MLLEPVEELDMPIWKYLWKIVVVNVDGDALKTLQLWFWIGAHNLELNSLCGIQGVFRVLESVGAEKGEYVLLLQNNKHFCTCALLKNKGIACRHFFWLMREDGRFVYNIQHIPRRWFRAERQADLALLSDLNKVRLLTSSTRKAQATKEIVDDATTVGIATSVDFFEAALIEQPKKERRVQQKRDNMLKGMLRVLNDYISTPTAPQAVFSAAYNNAEQEIMASIPEGHRHLLRGSAAKGQNENKPAQGNSSNKDIQRKKPVITVKENTKSVHQSGDHQSDTSNIDNNNHKHYTNDQETVE